MESADALTKEICQGLNVVRIGRPFLGCVDLRIKRRFLFLRDTNRILPKPGIYILLSDHWSGFFAGDGRALAHERFVLRYDTSHDRYKRQQRPPREIKLSRIVPRPGCP